MKRTLLGLLFGGCSLVAFDSSSLAATPSDSNRYSSQVFGASIFSDESHALWPLEVGAELIALDTETTAIPLTTMVADDGEATTFSHLQRTPMGQQRFELTMVARHLIEDEMELEYDLVVYEARYKDMNWFDYTLHRLNLASRPDIGHSEMLSVQAR